MPNNTDLPVKPLSEELVKDAAFSSLEGYAFLVVDSIEFELGRELTSEEAQQVCRTVESIVNKGASHE